MKIERKQQVNWQQKVLHIIMLPHHVNELGGEPNG